jgi:hypothetical protein
MGELDGATEVIGLLESAISVKEKQAIVEPQLRRGIHLYAAHGVVMSCSPYTMTEQKGFVDACRYLRKGRGIGEGRTICNHR